MKRFAMTFDNPGQSAIRQSIMYHQQKQTAKPSNRRIDLATPMIERVYKAKPGCSACGK